MAKNREKMKRNCYIVGETCGQLARFCAKGMIAFFFVGELAMLLWDNEERKERNSKTNKN